MNKSSIIKYVVGAVIVITFIAYLIFSNESSTPSTAINTPSVATNGSSTATTDSTTTTSTVAGGISTAAQYKDGTYTGSVADAFYGNLQAVAVIKGGVIVDIQFPQAPSGGHSSDVSSEALPVLKQEAITTQSANVDTVSGATQDTEAFNQSLAVALAQAKK